MDCWALAAWEVCGRLFWEVNLSSSTLNTHQHACQCETLNFWPFFLTSEIRRDIMTRERLLRIASLCFSSPHPVAFSQFSRTARSTPGLVTTLPGGPVPCRWWRFLPADTAVSGNSFANLRDIIYAPAPRGQNCRLTRTRDAY